jgi:hypothetical protein
MDTEVQPESCVSVEEAHKAIMGLDMGERWKFLYGILMGTTAEDRQYLGGGGCTHVAGELERLTGVFRSSASLIGGGTEDRLRMVATMKEAVLGMLADKSRYVRWEVAKGLIDSIQPAELGDEARFCIMHTLASITRRFEEAGK